MAYPTTCRSLFAIKVDFKKIVVTKKEQDIAFAFYPALLLINS
jgi:hypothetical protein